MNLVIKKPIISEKSLKQAQNGEYTFLVDRLARKPVVAEAVANHFGVIVTSIKLLTYKALSNQQRSRRGKFTMPGYKKAVVQLKKGQKIDLFDSQKEEEVVVTTGEGEPIVVKEKKSLLRNTKVKIEKSDKRNEISDTKEKKGKKSK